MAVRDFLREQAKKRGDAVFEVDVDDGRTAVCWRALAQPYSNCEFSAGLVDELPPEDVYLMLDKEEAGEQTILFLRYDEALAIINVLSGALWSWSMMQDEEEHT